MRKRRVHKEPDLQLDKNISTDKCRAAWLAGKKRIEVGGTWFRLQKKTVGNVDYISVFPEGTKVNVPVTNFPLSERQYQDEMSLRGTPEADRKPLHGHAKSK